MSKVHVYDDYLSKHPGLFKIFLKDGKMINIDYFEDKEKRIGGVKIDGIDNIGGTANNVFLVFSWIIAKCEIEAQKFIDKNYS